MHFYWYFLQWRRRRDSNPRGPFEPNGFQDRRFQPLTHSSICDSIVLCELATKLLYYHLSRPWRRAALDLPPGISSPARGSLPPRGFMSLSKALKFARDLRSARNSVVCKAELFSHRCGHELIYARPVFLALAFRALFRERGHRKG